MSGADAGATGAANPFAWPGDDPVSRAVRASCDVVEQAVRRGFGLGREPSSGPPWMTLAPWAASWSGGPTGGPAGAPWTTGQWVDAMTSVAGQWAQWFDIWSAMARSAVGGDPAAGPWTRSAATSASSSPAAAGAPAALHLTVELRAARAASIELDLPGLAAGTALEVHGLLALPAAAAPPITDVTLAITGAGVTIALGSIESHPAGTYAGAVLAAGRACGTLTVRLT